MKQFFRRHLYHSYSTPIAPTWSRPRQAIEMVSKSHLRRKTRPRPLLSPREKVILRCITEGASNKCIARKIDIAEATVKVHVKAILRKIRVQNRTQAAIWGINNGSHIEPEVAGLLCSPSLADAKIVSAIPTGPQREG